MKVKISLLLPAILIFTNSLNSQVVSRYILALYDSERGQTTTKNHIHFNAEVILNHLGVIVDYWDIKKGFPAPEIMQKYSGILTWFYSNSMNHPEEYLNWASKQIAAKRKFVILGNLGAFQDKATGNLLNISTINDFCKRLGFMVDDRNWSDNVTKIELVYKDSKMVEFERSLEYELTNYAKYKSTSSHNKVYLKIKRNDFANSESDLVFTTPHGGFAAAPYVIYENQEDYKKKWRINPFKFFAEAFGLEDLPKPDVTTLNGLRIWCSHIDGDALISRSEIKPNVYCGEIIRDEILKKYQWPVSVSVVVSDVEKSAKYEEMARSIFRIKWVEAASHSYSHPFYWADDYAGKDNYASRHLPIKGYTFNLKKEILGSVNYINKRLLPPDKKVKIFFWTGNSKPTPEALKLCQEINLNNFNGGDTVFDKNNPSYTNVTPLGAQVGEYRQIYSPNANENIYTNEWSAPYYGFKFVLNTFQNTESPIRIKPINIYYHFYSGEKWAGLNALKEVMDKTIVQEVAPMFISDYIAIVQGFSTTQIEKIAKDRWRIQNFGKGTTIRFDNTKKFPDLKKSSGILGFLHYQGALYLHLKNTDEAVVVLTNTRPEETYLEKGSHRIFTWQASRKNVSFQTEGFGKGQFVIANLLKRKTYQISIKELQMKGKYQSTNLIMKTDALGKLTILHPMKGAIAVHISLVP